MRKPTTKERAQLLIESAIEACQSAIKAPLFMSDEQVEAAKDDLKAFEAIYELIPQIEDDAPLPIHDRARQWLLEGRQMVDHMGGLVPEMLKDEVSGAIKEQKEVYSYLLSLLDQTEGDQALRDLFSRKQA
jgi:hypothetical protein